MAIFVYDKSGAFVAQISKQPKGADTFDPCLPWLLLHNTGKTRKNESREAARDEALKAYPGCAFKRN
jgi:hypothetical protein